VFGVQSALHAWPGPLFGPSSHVSSASIAPSPQTGRAPVDESPVSLVDVPVVVVDTSVVDTTTVADPTVGSSVVGLEDVVEVGGWVVVPSMPLVVAPLVVDTPSSPQPEIAPTSTRNPLKYLPRMPNPPPAVYPLAVCTSAPRAGGRAARCLGGMVIPGALRHLSPIEAPINISSQSLKTPGSALSRRTSRDKPTM
jgi:hypothetical protein